MLAHNGKLARPGEVGKVGKFLVILLVAIYRIFWPRKRAKETGSDKAVFIEPGSDG